MVMVEQMNLATSPKRSGGPSNALTHRDFFAEVVDRLRATLPSNLAAFREKRNSYLLKVYYDNERVHYEVALYGHQQLTEIGLHFEDGPISTVEFLTYFDQHIVELKHELGPEIELERWTQSWGHLYELWPLTTLTERIADRAAGRLAEMIRVLQPLVDEASVAPERSLHPSESFDQARRWRQRRR